MYLITVALVVYVVFGWLTLRSFDKETPILRYILNSLFLVMFMYAVFYIAEKIDINIQILILFSLGIGALAYRGKCHLYGVIPSLLGLCSAGYYFYLNGILSSIYLYILSVALSFIVYVPLQRMPLKNPKFTLHGSLMIAYALSLLAFGNSILNQYLSV